MKTTTTTYADGSPRCAVLDGTIPDDPALCGCPECQDVLARRHERHERLQAEAEIRAGATIAAANASWYVARNAREAAISHARSLRRAKARCCGAQ